MIIVQEFSDPTISAKSVSQMYDAETAFTLTQPVFMFFVVQKSPVISAMVNGSCPLNCSILAGTD